MSFAAGIVAPITVVGALLFYFGYVSARAQYEYFGIDVDTIGLSTQDYVMRSPQPLLVPLLVLTLLAVAGSSCTTRISPDPTHHADDRTPCPLYRARVVAGRCRRPVCVPAPRRPAVLRAGGPGRHRPGRGRPRVPVVPGLDSNASALDPPLPGRR